MAMGKKHLSVTSMDHHQSEDNNCKNSLFFGLFDDPESTRLRNGSMKRQYSDMGDSYHNTGYEEQDDDDDEGSKMDMRVLMVLEYMRELYVGQFQLLKKMFPGGAKDEFLGFFNKIGEAVSQFKQDSPRPVKSKTMERSLSTGSPRVYSKGVSLGPSDLKDERFKVTTVNDMDLRDERFKITTVTAGVGSGGTGGAAGGDKGGTVAGQGQTKK